MQRYKKYPFGVGIVNKNRLAASYIKYYSTRARRWYSFSERMLGYWRARLMSVMRPWALTVARMLYCSVALPPSRTISSLAGMIIL